MKANESKDGPIVEVTVKLNARDFRIAVEGNDIVVFCTEAPVKGRVNRELIKGLSKMLKRQIVLISGFASRQKRVLIRNIDREALEEAFRQK